MDETGNVPFDYCMKNHNYESIKHIQHEIECFRAPMDLDSFEFAIEIGNENSIWMIEKALF